MKWSRISLHDSTSRRKTWNRYCSAQANVLLWHFFPHMQLDPETKIWSRPWHLQKYWNDYTDLRYRKIMQPWCFSHFLGVKHFVQSSVFFWLLCERFILYDISSLLPFSQRQNNETSPVNTDIVSADRCVSVAGDSLRESSEKDKHLIDLKTDTICWWTKDSSST